MNPSTTIADLTDRARDLGFGVSCHGGAGSVEIQGNDLHFGGTLDECSAFLAGWGLLRSRLLDTLGGGPICRGDARQPPLSRGPARCACGPGDYLTLLSGASGTGNYLSLGESDASERALERSPLRDRRQAMAMAWVELAFGREEATGLPQRGLRVLEEAIEVFQACGGAAEVAQDLVTFVFAHPCGRIGQEVGGVAVSLLALAAAAGLSADAEECRELQRVLSKPVEEFALRNAGKIKISHVYALERS